MIESLLEYLAVARGEKKAELVFKEARIVNVYTNEIICANLAVHQGKIIGWGDYRGEKEVEMDGSYVIPGLIDAHFHVESSMLLPDELSRQIIPRGTTTLVVDPHEIANVAGVKGIEFIRQYHNHLALNLFVQLPSCVPATRFEESGAVLRAEDLATFLDLPGIMGLGEVMDFHGVVDGEIDLLKKLEIMGDRFIDGHAPLLKGKDLNAYILAGIMADHECTVIEEAKEKIRRGMYVMIREGSAAKDLIKLLPLIDKENSRRFVFCSDDRHPADLRHKGHMDFIVKKAISAGLNPIEAIKIATLNAAECLGLSNLGAIAPGKCADLVIVDDLNEFKVLEVYKDGQLVAQNGELLQDFTYRPDINLKNTVQAKKLTLEDLLLPSAEKYRVIQIHEGELLTSEIIQSVSLNQTGSEVYEDDIVKIIVVDRYGRIERIGRGFIKGTGLKSGAMGSSVAHDSHNLIAIGRDDASIQAVLNGIITEQGGIAVAKEGQLLDILPLPIGGLISDQNLAEVEEKLTKLHLLAKSLGITLCDPFMTLSFMALPVIPELKMTSRGLFDVRANKLVSPVIE